MKSDRFIIQTISVVICLFLIVYVSFHSVNLDSQPYQTEVARPIPSQTAWRPRV